MTDILDADIVTDLTETEARQLTDRIRVGWESIAPLVAEAFHRRAWAALGYQSWDGYCDGEISGFRPALPVTTRRETVAKLSDSGMSQRAIGTALDIDHKTAAADLKVARGENSPRLTVTDTLGRQQPASKPTEALRKFVDRPTIPFGPKPTIPADVHPPANPVLDDPAAAAAASPARRPAPSLDDVDEVLEEKYRATTAGFEQGLVNVWLTLAPDPLDWFANRNRPSGKFRNVPQAQDPFTVAGLRQLAQHLSTLANHLDQTGEAL